MLTHLCFTHLCIFPLRARTPTPHEEACAHSLSGDSKQTKEQRRFFFVYMPPQFKYIQLAPNSRRASLRLADLELSPPQISVRYWFILSLVGSFVCRGFMPCSPNLTLRTDKANQYRFFLFEMKRHPVKSLNTQEDRPI